jgi:hypothetical protein
MKEYEPSPSILNEPQREVAANLQIPEEIWSLKPVQDFLSRVAAVRDIQGDLASAAAPTTNEPLPLRQRYRRAELLTRVTLMILEHSPGDPAVADPQGYLMGKINQAIMAYGLQVVPVQETPSPLDNPSISDPSLSGSANAAVTPTRPL